MTTPQTQKLFYTVGSLATLAHAAHEAGDRQLCAQAKADLEELHGIRLSFARRRKEQKSTVIPLRCPACGSHERGNFKNVKRHQGNGYIVVWRNCNCSDCGQLYRVRELTRDPT